MVIETAHVRSVEASIVFKQPPHGISPEDAERYLATLRGELERHIDPKKDPLERIRFDLVGADDNDNGQINSVRGGYFVNAELAISTLLWDVVDRARELRLVRLPQ